MENDKNQFVEESDKSKARELYDDKSKVRELYDDKSKGLELYKENPIEEKFVFEETHDYDDYAYHWREPLNARWSYNSDKYYYDKVRDYHMKYDDILDNDMRTYFDNVERLVYEVGKELYKQKYMTFNDLVEPWANYPNSREDVPKYKIPESLVNQFKAISQEAVKAAPNELKPKLENSRILKTMKRFLFTIFITIILGLAIAFIIKLIRKRKYSKTEKNHLKQLRKQYEQEKTRLKQLKLQLKEKGLSDQSLNSILHRGGAVVELSPILSVNNQISKVWRFSHNTLLFPIRISNRLENSIFRTMKSTTSRIVLKFSNQPIFWVTAKVSIVSIKTLITFVKLRRMYLVSLLIAFSILVPVPGGSRKPTPSQFTPNQETNTTLIAPYFKSKVSTQVPEFEKAQLPSLESEKIKINKKLNTISEVESRVETKLKNRTHVKPLKTPVSTFPESKLKQSRTRQKKYVPLEQRTMTLRQMTDLYRKKYGDEFAAETQPPYVTPAERLRERIWINPRSDN